MNSLFFCLSDWGLGLSEIQDLTYYLEVLAIILSRMTWTFCECYVQLILHAWQLSVFSQCLNSLFEIIWSIKFHYAIFFFQVRGCLWSNFFYHHVFFNNKANWNLSKSKSRNLCMFHKTRTKPLLDNSYRYSRQLCLDKFWNESLVLGPKCCFYAKGGAFGHFGEVTFSH